MSENDDISSSKSLLAEDVIAILNEDMIEGFKDGRLELGMKDINDSMIPEICEWIVKLADKVKILNLRQNRITSVGASMLFDTLKANNSSIKVIYSYRNSQIDDKCMKSLGEYIKSNKSLEIISLDETSISDAGIRILAPYLESNTTFKQLYLDENKGITDKSIPFLMKIIESSCIENIGVYNTSITQKNTINALLACNRVKNGSKKLELPNNDLNDDDLIKICDAMKKYGIDKLKEIHLQHNKITSKGASVLFDTLKECSSVVLYLDILSNKLDDECMKEIGEYLQDNEYVKSLTVGNSLHYAESNKITDKGIEILSEYLIGNTTLKGLYLGGNKGITDVSVPYFIELVKRSCISYIGAINTSISGEKKQEINKALSMPIEEREIPVKSNTKSAAKLQLSSASAST